MSIFIFIITSEILETEIVYFLRTKKNTACDTMK